MSLLGLTPSSAPAIIDTARGSQLSYADLIDRGEGLAANMGATKSLLFVLCRNDSFTACAYAGCLRSGHAVALLDDGQTDEVIADLVTTYRPPWLAGPAGSAARLADAGVPVGSPVELPGGELVPVAAAPAPRIHPDLQLLLSTSGTTGSRKFVRLSASNIEANAVAIAEYLGLTPDERPMAWLPLHYSFGLSILNSHWHAGAAVVLTQESPVQGAFWDAFRAHACTSLAGVPYSFHLLERIGFRKMDLPSLTSMQQAGGALGPGLATTYADYMAARGGRFFVMYGQTEATARMAYVPPASLPERSGSAGRAIAGGHLRIEPGGHDPSGRPVGEVVYEGPNVMLGYAGDAQDLATGDELGGVLHTGDTGFIDEDGFLYIVGRSKRIAKVFGLRVNLDEVETSLREHGPAAVVGDGEALWAFCAFGTDRSVNELGDQMAIRYRISRSALHFQRVELIPTAASGKTDYQEVRRWVPR